MLLFPVQPEPPTDKGRKVPRTALEHAQSRHTGPNDCVLPLTLNSQILGLDQVKVRHAKCSVTLSSNQLATTT